MKVKNDKKVCEFRKENVTLAKNNNLNLYCGIKKEIEWKK